MVLALDSAVSIELLSVAGAALVALIGGVFTVVQSRAMSRRAKTNGANGMTAELWSEIREELRQARADTTRLTTDLSTCQARVTVLTDELARTRRGTDG